MDFNSILSIVQIIGLFAVLYGIWLTVKQLKFNRIQRRDLAIMECARSFEDQEFTEAYRLLTSIGEPINSEKLEILGEEFEVAALRVAMKFETMGLLVFKQVVPIDAMEDLVGGAALTIWELLGEWVKESRSSRSHPSFMEWYQWLVDRLNDRKRKVQAAAYITHKNWKPQF